MIQLNLSYILITLLAVYAIASTVYLYKRCNKIGYGLDRCEAHLTNERSDVVTCHDRLIAGLNSQANRHEKQIGDLQSDCKMIERKMEELSIQGNKTITRMVGIPEAVRINQKKCEDIETISKMQAELINDLAKSISRNEENIAICVKTGDLQSQIRQAVVDVMRQMVDIPTDGS